MSDAELKNLASLTPAERELLAELLEAERHRLLLEIRHADHRQFREELGRRFDLVELLAARMHEPAAT